MKQLSSLQKLFFAVFIFLFLLSHASAQDEAKKFPGDALGYFYSGMYFDGKANYDKAMTLYDLSIKENPKLVDPRFYKSQVYLRLEKFDDALNELNTIKAMPEQETITAELTELNVDSEISKVKQKIQEKLKAKNPPQKKKKFWEKLFAFKLGEKKKEAVEEPRGKLMPKGQDVFPAVVVYISDTKVKIYKGEKDNFKAGDELILVEKEHIVGKAKLTEVKAFYSLGELLNFEPSRQYKEGDTLAGGFYIPAPTAEQQTP